jgi:hypothetical protein
LDRFQQEILFLAAIIVYRFSKSTDALAQAPADLRQATYAKDQDNDPQKD